MFYRAKAALRKFVPPGAVLFMHKAQSVLAALSYGFPAKKLTIIGVAGTKGKTTTSNFIYQILEESGAKAAMFSTANIKICGEEFMNYTKMTTPSPWILQSFLAEAVREGVKYAIVEISSHGLKQRRDWGVDYDIVVLTNLMADHLDYHKTSRDYRSVHLKMFGKKTSGAVINSDDKNLREFAKMPVKILYKFSVMKDGLCPSFSGRLRVPAGKRDKTICETMAFDCGLTSEGSEFKFLAPEGCAGIKLGLPGKFNIYNFLAAASVGLVLGIPLPKIKAALEKVRTVPGRLENIKASPKQDFRVIVDYAHSPDSLRVFYETMTANAKGRVIAVLGGTGDRDKTYRAKVGVLADQCADMVIVTNEDPYSEDPEKIIDQVMAGIKNKKLDESLFRVSDRGEAIAKAVALAQKDDMILITGKGAEQFIVAGDKKIPWDDRKVAYDALTKRFAV